MLWISALMRYVLSTGETLLKPAGSAPQGSQLKSGWTKTESVSRAIIIGSGNSGVYYGENVPLFRRNGYRKPGAMIP